MSDFSEAIRSAFEERRIPEQAQAHSGGGSVTERRYEITLNEYDYDRNDGGSVSCTKRSIQNSISRKTSRIRV